MKIRCIDTDKERLTLNKEYEVIKSDNYWYWFVDDIGGHNGYRKSLFEIVEEKNRLNIIEAMKMPVGTEFKVIFNGEIMENNTMIIYQSLEGDKNKHMDWKCRPLDTFMKPYDFLINGIFIPISKPVSFMEALANDKKCNVRNNIIEQVYRKQKEHDDDEYKIDIVKNLLEEKYYHMNDIIYAISGYMGCDDWEKLINDGDFYIEKQE